MKIMQTLIAYVLGASFHKCATLTVQSCNKVPRASTSRPFPSVPTQHRPSSGTPSLTRYCK